MDTAYLNSVEKLKSIYAEKIFLVHQQKEIQNKISQKHLQFWDDIVPVYLTAPMLFNVKNNGGFLFATLDEKLPVVFLTSIITDVLMSGIKSNNRIFISFPFEPSLYKPAVEKILPDVIEKYGEIETKAIVLTNEIHGHTGIYSIIGAKMGIRAIEYFNVGVNNLFVISFAGSEPPLSCLNDGIQISTGSTIGQGLIELPDSLLKAPAAIFEFNGQRIKISLKFEIDEQIQKDIEIGVENYGFSAQYWLYIEDLAIKYWDEFDRHEIFDIQKL